MLANTGRRVLGHCKAGPGAQEGEDRQYGGRMYLLHGTTWKTVTVMAFIRLSLQYDFLKKRVGAKL